jgi:hypothetical protein
MSVSTTFSEAADLIRRNVYALLVIGAIVFVPADLLTALIDDTRGWGDASFGRVALFTVALLLAWTFAYGSAIAAIAVEPEGAEERPRTPLLALRDAGRGWPTLVAILVIGGVATIAGFALLIVPGVVLTTWWSLAYQSALVESAGWRASLGRSRQLVRGSFWLVLFVLVVVTVSVVLFDYAVYRVAEASLPDLAAGWVAGIISDAVAVSVFAAITTALYWQLSGYRTGSRSDPPAEIG